MSVVPTPLAFFEMDEELFLPDATEFYEAVFGEAPEGFDAINVNLTPSELVFVMVNSMMLVTIGYQPVISLPSIGLDITASLDVSLEDRHQLLLGAVLHHTDEEPIAAFMEPQDRDLTPGTTASLASYSALKLFS